VVNIKYIEFYYVHSVIKNMLNNNGLSLLPTSMILAPWQFLDYVGDGEEAIEEHNNFIIQHVFNENNNSHLSFYINNNIILYEPQTFVFINTRRQLRKMTGQDNRHVTHLIK